MEGGPEVVGHRPDIVLATGDSPFLYVAQQVKKLHANSMTGLDSDKPGTD